MATLQLTDDVARVLRGVAPPTDASRALVARAARLGLTLRPQHPSANAVPLASYFVADGAVTEATLDALREDPSVLGAWTTPAEALPRGAR